ncbi:MAG: DUF3305 domain-containing protein [Candidatus Thiodiazotropha sp. (ex Ctena orbiculata)]|uniref:DUF3305 domain-containing protein n=1 Tax=Candidatus Thiodiazotropha taylori TaxID=2792791 RepID=A0A944M8Z9_9GAMM|nr:DUF3305 domain-containing protein [Candidatus Thiodiazotropha taylori]MBT2989290.1 DUF3305 domain-containing protein [Candidatus Thiodiazotropha taylori]MBT2996870.1 DUF3305 domain-containing protein [Candidatus Thiodiazotropha taylori]MBT3000725.1 DUF3305 domain-containing protein [Candidatus Thiodiazotropha taylori]MBT3029394.1 DUF3305 domain-containing protein [Candidatus Thiodiazotropha taylori]
MTTANNHRVGDDNPSKFNVSVIMQQSPSDSPWLENSWEAVGLIAAGETLRESDAKSSQIHRKGVIARFLYSGFTLKLHRDECESYYYNLLSPQPHCYVVANLDDQGKPEPFLVSLSYDEAHAYLEGDETVYTVPMPAELYRWTEAFVLEHYTPKKRSKRKRADWKSSQQRPQ